MKKTFLNFTLALSSLFIVAQADEQKMLAPTSYEKVAPKIAKGAAMMLEFGSTHCHSCQELGKLLYTIKEKHPKSNIYFINLYEDMEAAKKYGVMMIPTQIYLDSEGKVVDKHIGMMKADELDKKLTEMGIL